LFHENVTDSRAVESFDEYTLFRSNYPDLKKDNAKSKNLEILKQQLFLNNTDEVEVYLKERGIEFDKIFPSTVVTTSKKLVDGVFDLWKHKLTYENFSELEKRSEVLQLLPDMGSLTMSSLNFPSGTSVNQPNMILSLIDEMNKYGVQPEIECFDTGMLNYTNYLISKGKLTPPYHINFILGNIYNGQCDLSNLSSIKVNLPSNSYTCLGGIGDQQLKSNLYGFLEFDGVRIGLEDNLYLKEKKKTTNIELLKRLHRIMNELDITHYTSKELKELGYGNKIINNR
jgi:uncharacterized protein (DUF849 family)